MHRVVALFGEAEKGEYKNGYLCQSMADLSEQLGEPPSEDAKGLPFAIQALLYQHTVLFFRVHEEGFSDQDYLEGFDLLSQKEKIPNLTALCLPGVGNSEIIEATTPVCATHRSLLVITEKDLYDYLTFRG